jgi:hypothetical protein
MDTETAPPSEGQTVTALVSGIVADAQELVKQQVALLRAEVKEDFRRAGRAAVLLAVGSVTAVPAIVLLSFTIVYAINAGGLPLWASFLIVGGAAAIFSAILIGIGVQRFRSFNPVPDQTVEAFKENVRWMTTPK